VARFSVPGFAVSLFALAWISPVAAQFPQVLDVENGAIFTSSYGGPGSPVAPGSIISIFGTNFASSLLQSMTVPLSTSLGNVSVTFDGTRAPLFFVLPGDFYDMIVAQLPSQVVGPISTVQVSTDWGVSFPQNIQINVFSPAIFTDPPGGVGQGVVVFSHEPSAFAAVPSFWFPHDRPANAGDFLTIYANGLGPVYPRVADGAAAPLPPHLAKTVQRPMVWLGGVPCPVLFSGLAPGSVGLNQINIQVPKDAPTGPAVPIQITMGGLTSSDQVTIAVQ
jgi:uncharacterized protein (TIGR03437 family)